MKYREGYVSNSSSSSFMIRGKEIKDKTALKNVIEDGRTVWFVGEGEGTSGDVADFIMKLTRENVDMMGDAVEELWEGKDRHVIMEMKNGGNVYEFDMDQNSPLVKGDVRRDWRFLRWLSDCLEEFERKENMKRWEEERKRREEETHK